MINLVLIFNSNTFPQNINFQGIKNCVGRVTFWSCHNSTKFPYVLGKFPSDNKITFRND